MALFHQRLLQRHVGASSSIPCGHAVILKQWADNLAKGIYDSETQNDSEFIQQILYLKYLEGRDVRRYFLDWSGEYLSYGDWLAEPHRSVKFDQPRILARQIPFRPPCPIDSVLVPGDALNDINSMVIQDDISYAEENFAAVKLEACRLVVYPDF